MCAVDYALLLDLFKSLWSWVTLVALALFLYRSELRELMGRIARTREATVGNVTLKLPDEDNTVPVPAPPSTSPEIPTDKAFTAQLQGQRLTGVVHIDGKQFISCIFEDATLIFSGTAPLSFISCTFGKGLTWEFAGNAGLTLGFMQSMYHGGASEMIEATIERLIRNKTPAAAA